MELLNIQTNREKKRYIEFIYKVYKNNPCFVDTLVGIVKTFLYKKDSFTKECIIKPVAVQEGDQTICQCMLVYNEKLPALQIAFFEALPNQQAAVEILISEAKRQCIQLNLKKLIVGLNGHVSYGVGLLLDHYDSKIPFDSLYTQSYYTEYFNAYKRQTLTTYGFDMKNISFKSSVLDRARRKVSLRTLDMKSFKDEMLIFGDLCNRTLKDTYLYFYKEPVCTYEIIKEMKAFLAPENLIFAMCEGKEVGFLFSHPDYNEIITGGKKNSMIDIGFAYLKNKNKIKSMKINAIGVLPAFKRTGVTALLFYEAYKYTQNRYIGGESNFVWDNNTDSRLLSKHLNDREFRHYCVYEIDL